MLSNLYNAVENESSLPPTGEAFIAGYLTGRGRLQSGMQDTDTQAGSGRYFRVKTRNPDELEFVEMALEYITGSSTVVTPPTVTLHWHDAIESVIEFLSQYSKKYAQLQKDIEATGYTVEDNEFWRLYNTALDHPVDVLPESTGAVEEGFVSGVLDAGQFSLHISKQPPNDRHYLREIYCLPLSRLNSLDLTRVKARLDEFDIPHYRAERDSVGSLSVANSNVLDVFTKVVGFERSIRNRYILDFYQAEVGASLCYEKEPEKFHSVFSMYTEFFGGSSRYSPDDFNPDNNLEEGVEQMM